MKSLEPFVRYQGIKKFINKYRYIPTYKIRAKNKAISLTVELNNKDIKVRYNTNILFFRYLYIKIQHLYINIFQRNIYLKNMVELNLQLKNYKVIPFALNLCRIFSIHILVDIINKEKRGYYHVHLINYLFKNIISSFISRCKVLVQTGCN